MMDWLGVFGGALLAGIFVTLMGIHVTLRDMSAILNDIAVCLEKMRNKDAE